MKKHKIAFMVCLLACLAWAAGAAPVLQPLTVEEAAMHQATHVFRVLHSDLTETTTNTAQTVTFPVAAKMGVRLVKMELWTAFEDEATNAHNATAMIVGDGNDPDRFLASTELNVNGTEVYLKAGRGSWQTATTATLTNLTSDGDAHYSAATLAVVTAETQSDDYTVYTGTDTVDVTFTPVATYALSALDKGEVRLYFVVDQVGRR